MKALINMPKGIPKNGINKSWIKKGTIPWNKDIPHSKETIEKMKTKRALQTNVFPIKSVQYLGWEANRGKKRTLEQIKRISDSHLGQIAWNKGKSYLQIRGEKNPNWKGGISKINKTERQLIMEIIEYKLWRDSVLARDGYICQKYNVKGGKLVVHHINNFLDFPELRFAIDNGITLSEKAHKEFHKKYGNKNNSREQLEEFINI